MHRYRFDRTGEASVVIDLAHSLTSETIQAAYLEQTAPDEISGMRNTSAWVNNQPIYCLLYTSVTEYQPEKAWKRLVKQMKQSGVPWTMIFGNHDHEQGLTRDELFDMVKAAPNCLMEKGLSLMHIYGFWNLIQ